MLANFANVFEEVVMFDCVDYRDCYGTSQWAAAEGRAVHAGSDRFSCRIRAQHCTYGDAIGDGFGDRGDIGQDAVVLVGEPFACTAKTALNLVCEQEGPSGVAEFARGGEELSRYGVNATLALDWLDADGADVFGKLCAEIGDVVEPDKLDAGHDGFEGFAILRLVGRGDRTHRSSVKAMFYGEELGPDLAALGTKETCMSARQFEGGLPRLGTAVAKEDAVQAANLCQTQRQFGRTFVKEKVRRVQKASALAMDSFFDSGVSVTERRYADAA